MVIETPSSSLSFPCLLIFPVAFLDDGGSQEGPWPGPSSTASSASFSRSRSEDTRMPFLPYTGAADTVTGVSCD